MRRSVATIVGTLVGSALLVGAKLGTHPPAGPDVVAAATAPGGEPSPGPVATPGSTRAAGTPSRGKPAATRPAATKPATTKPATGWKDGTFTGGGAAERYGTITVTVTVSGGRLTDAQATCTGCGGTSRAISGNAFPTLRQETLVAQSARISTVSGATYTSGAYRASLQSALDTART
jgi:uncharacterized protein with FMN-binding domain